MNAFEVVTIIVSIVAISLAASSYFRVNRVLKSLGRQGMSLYRGTDTEISARRSEDEREPPLPMRPIRGRPE